MRTLDSKTTADRSVVAAHRRGRQSPEARLACPVCATSLKGANFTRHLHDKHPDIEEPDPSKTLEDLRLVGIDHRIRRTFAGLGVLWLAIFMGTMFLDDGKFSSEKDRTLAEIVRQPFALVVAGGTLLVIVIALLRAATVFRARLIVSEDGIRLRHRLGTGHRYLPLPAAIETGSLFSVHPDPSNNDQSDDASVKRHAGSYLRVTHGRRSITVGCPHAAGLRKHWTGWKPGKRRKWWDVDLSAAAFVELQYALAEAGCLQPSD